MIQSKQELSICWWLHNENQIHLHNSILFNYYEKMKSEGKWMELETIILR